MTRVVVIDAGSRRPQIDWWRWGVIALATTVLCSCSALPESRPANSLQHVQRIEQPARSQSLAPIVVPDRNFAPAAKRAGGECFELTDAQVESGWPAPGAGEACLQHCGPMCFPRDEYLCDGGDGDYRGTVDAIDGEGIEPSDTIAQFDSELIRGHVVASNRVCIYAPRFAATRKVIRLRQDESFSRAGGLHEATQPRAEAAPSVPNNMVAELATERQISDTIKHELQDASRGLLLEDADGPAETGRRELPFESRAAVQGVQFDAIERPWITQQDVPAIQWTDIQAVELAIDGRPAQAVSDVGPPSDVHIYEVHRTPRLCLTKTLSSRTAQPGETVLITIHYENIGDSQIDNLRIVDNLTTRLEFLPDSDVSSRRAMFSTRDNAAGSSKLLWEVRETIRPGEHGEVQFRCRVR